GRAPGGGGGRGGGGGGRGRGGGGRGGGPRAGGSRSAMPCRPVPWEALGVSKPSPSSATANCRWPPGLDKPMVAWEARAYLAVFCRASRTQKYTAASASRGQRPMPAAS